MSKMIDAMMKPMHQMIHEQYEKDKDKLPTDFEARSNKVIDDYLKKFPWDEIVQAMVPVCTKKHLTKGDVDHLVAFLFESHWAKIPAGDAGHHVRGDASDDAADAAENGCDDAGYSATNR